MVAPSAVGIASGALGKETICLVIRVLENQILSSTFLEKTICPKLDHPENVGLILVPPRRFAGSLTNGSFLIALSRSPESMQAADIGSQVCLQGKQAAWDPAWLLSEPMHYSEICQLQFVFVFFPSGEMYCQKFPASSALFCHCLSRWKWQKSQRALQSEGTGPWET